MAQGNIITTAEKEFVKANCMTMSRRDIAKHLGRSYYTICDVMKSLGVNSQHRFTPEDDKEIRRLYGLYSAEYIATRLHIDKTAVYNRVKKLGLKKNKARK